MFDLDLEIPSLDSTAMAFWPIFYNFIGKFEIKHGKNSHHWETPWMSPSTLFTIDQGVCTKPKMPIILYKTISFINIGNFQLSVSSVTKLSDRSKFMQAAQ